MLFVVILVWGCTYKSSGGRIPSPSPDPFDPFKENELVLLAKAVSRALNLSHCWVCRGPPGLSSRPWTSTPLTPAQIVSRYSETTNSETTSDSRTWPVQFPAVGQYCLNRAQKGGVYVGETLRNKLATANRGISIWAWLDNAGRRRGFRGYWVNKNKTSILQPSRDHSYKQTCEWKNNSGAWNCTGRTNKNPTVFFSPVGNDNTTYSQFPEDAAGPFANGARAKRGQYWICGHSA